MRRVCQLMSRCVRLAITMFYGLLIIGRRVG